MSLGVLGSVFAPDFNRLKNLPKTKVPSNFPSLPPRKLHDRMDEQLNVTNIDILASIHVLHLQPLRQV
jgi:hypothetical protein